MKKGDDGAPMKQFHRNPRVNSDIMNSSGLQEFDDGDIVQRASIMSYPDSQPDDDIPGKKNMKSGLAAALGEDPEEHADAPTLKKKLGELREAVAELYLEIKQKTRDENEATSPEEEQEEREIIVSLDSYVIIEYIKSSVDIILNLKFEEIEKRLLDKNGSQKDSTNPPSYQRHKPKDSGINHKRNESMPSVNNDDGNSMTERSTASHAEGPPKVYEELIQSLEADIRKHIRIEQQLKLHIESMENRIEELENENEKMEGDLDKFKKINTTKSKEVSSKVKELEDLVKAKDHVLKQHEQQMKTIKDNELRLRKEVDQLKNKIYEASQSKNIEQFSLLNISQQLDNASRTQEVGHIINKTQPMIIKQNSLAMGDPAHLQQLRKISSSNNEGAAFGSYSSNHSFADNQSPDRRTTPDITHPYLHHTQIIGKKKNQTPGTQSKPKKFTPNSVGDTLGMQPSFNSATTYNVSTSQQANIIGQRKLSSQATRNQTQPHKGLKTVSKNSWMGGHGSFAAHQPTQFSNIINNNIQGLSINYSNQIIQNNDPIQQFTNNFIPSQLQPNDSNTVHTDDSESSNLNSHRRCKSQNVKRERVEVNGSQMINKSNERKNNIKNAKKLLMQDNSQEEMMVVQQMLQADQDRGALKAFNENKFRSMAHPGVGSNIFEETAAFNEQKKNNQYFIVNESNRMAQDFAETHNNHRRSIKHAQSITSHTLSGQNTQKVRTASNRVQQSNHQALEDMSKNRFNQSYGGVGATTNKKSNHHSLTNGSAVIHSRNGNLIGNINQTSQSAEKTGQRSRNSKQKHHLTQNQTGTNQYQVKFDGNLMDMNFKTTTTSTSNQQTKPNIIGQTNSNNSFIVGSKGTNSASNNATFINQANLQILKQQLMAQKKASNLLMKGLSPLKKVI